MVTEELLSTCNWWPKSNYFRESQFTVTPVSKVILYCSNNLFSSKRKRIFGLLCYSDNVGRPTKCNIHVAASTPEKTN